MFYPIENNRGRIGGRWWAAVVLRGALPAAHRGGAGEMSALSLSRPTEDCAPLISYGSTVAPEEVPTINLPWWFYRGVLVGISGSGPPPLYAHYNLLLPTVPHENPSARPLRFSIGYSLTISSSNKMASKATLIQISISYPSVIVCFYYLRAAFYTFTWNQ